MINSFTKRMLGVADTTGLGSEAFLAKLFTVLSADSLRMHFTF